MNIKVCHQLALVVVLVAIVSCASGCDSDPGGLDTEMPTPHSALEEGAQAKGSTVAPLDAPKRKGYVWRYDVRGLSSFNIGGTATLSLPWIERWGRYELSGGQQVFAFSLASSSSIIIIYEGQDSQDTVTKEYRVPADAQVWLLRHDDVLANTDAVDRLWVSFLSLAAADRLKQGNAFSLRGAIALSQKAGTVESVEIRRLVTPEPIPPDAEAIKRRLEWTREEVARRKRRRKEDDSKLLRYNIEQDEAMIKHWEKCLADGPTQVASFSPGRIEGSWGRERPVWDVFKSPL